MTESYVITAKDFIEMYQSHFIVLQKTVTTTIKKVFMKKFDGRAIESTCSWKSRQQLEGALNLLTEAGMDPNVGTHDAEDFKILVAHLKDYRIFVWTIQKDTLLSEIIAQQNEQAHGMIPLLCIDGSYDFFIPTLSNVKLSYCFKCHDFGGRYHARTCSAICKNEKQ
ncbi:hypothetical protein CRE_02362 [Caenorhabditis remanei]|uniref:Uncharacterized protein n=1 Tax=Caenorhabditis remanei TaxID=31234 RepID=E3MIS9_CAERE|nr:hypothetical protein CRE_02362 [Caenorhabditis remanei]